MLAHYSIHATLPATDMERARRFYTEKLGLTAESECHLFYQDRLEPLSPRGAARCASRGINEGEFDRLPCRLLHRLSQLAHLRTVLLVAGVKSLASRLPSVSTAACTLLPLRRLAPS